MEQQAISVTPGQEWDNIHTHPKECSAKWEFAGLEQLVVAAV